MNWILTALFAISLPGFSQEVGKSCPDFSVTGIHSKDELLKFFGKLKAAAATKDITALSEVVIYPLNINAKRKRKPVKNTEELRKNFPSIFTVKVLNAIGAQNFEDLFCRDQGAMIGDGEVWISERNGKIGISAINL